MTIPRGDVGHSSAPARRERQRWATCPQVWLRRALAADHRGPAVGSQLHTRINTQCVECTYMPCHTTHGHGHGHRHCARYTRNKILKEEEVNTSITVLNAVSKKAAGPGDELPNL